MQFMPYGQPQNLSPSARPTFAGLIAGVASLGTWAGGATVAVFSNTALYGLGNQHYAIQYSNAGFTVVNSSNGQALAFAYNGAESARFAISGNLLLGTPTDSGNGKFQLATHTTSAGGIGFGTDWSLYRINSNNLIAEASNASGVVFSCRNLTQDAGIQVIANNGTVAGILMAQSSVPGVFLRTTTSSPLVFQPANVTALTLDASQNATFAGTVITLASAIAKAGLRIPHGAAPTTPTDGDLWTTPAGLFVRINGVTKTVTLT